PPPETKQQQVVAKEAEGPDQPSPETKKQQVIETKGEFVVQAGAFRSKKEARKRAAFLGNKYLEGKENFIYLAGPVTVRGESYYRVLLGPFHETRANTFLQQIEIEDRAGAFVRKITPSDR
ncbi:MAG: SPOR domain-containing protein, partial [bacterium]|nr:SPOR domain-containing protein [bacterium]